MRRSPPRLARILCLTLALCLTLCACSAVEGAPSPSPQIAVSPAAGMELDIAPLVEDPAVSNLLLPEASGTVVYENDAAEIDASHFDLGYIMIRRAASGEKRMKVIVTGPSTAAYTYNLSNSAEYAVFPLSDGNGTYSVGIYENAYDAKYALVLDAKLDVKLKDEFAPFLTPNQFVNYNETTKAVLLARELTGNMTGPIKKIETVFGYVVNGISYDYELAKTVQSGYLPDLDSVLARKKGICFDYAALMTAMLRSLGIPTKLVVGYTGSIYHAWISTYTEESGWVDGVIFFDGANWKLMDPTFLSAADKDDMADYTQNAANYQAKYLY
ncbi:MAG TPA: transglutaminase-like domain-containing protein [Clostridia bacterium]|nr:transglutaminase-like domain-containing protein [Clostridia bacterium]